jgi:hypothetical protein
LLHHVNESGRSAAPSSSCDEVSVALPRHTIPFFSVVARSHTSETRPGFDGGAYAAAESVR